MNYEEALAFLQAFPDMERATFGARGPTMGLPSMKSLLNRMGDPHKGIPTIHVTGSKGKGSTCTYLASILKAGGQRVALYTSPHLHDYTERIAFDLESISEELFAQGVAEIKTSVEAERDADPKNAPAERFAQRRLMVVAVKHEQIEREQDEHGGRKHHPMQHGRV